jgi:hypothetical protein
VITVGFRYLSGRGLSRFVLHLNSIGDENCRPAYREALVAFLEERKDRLSRDCRERMHVNPLRVLDCKDEVCRAALCDVVRTPGRQERRCAARDPRAGNPLPVVEEDPKERERRRRVAGRGHGGAGLDG